MFVTKVVTMLLNGTNSGPAENLLTAAISVGVRVVFPMAVAYSLSSGIESLFTIANRSEPDPLTEESLSKYGFVGKDATPLYLRVPDEVSSINLVGTIMPRSDPLGFPLMGDVL